MTDLPGFQAALLAWYDAHHRTLPWRADAPPPYHVLVSEAMLQQTQVATVIPYFLRFIEALPTVRTLADAEEATVLRLWQGLGYYRRARNLQAAARAIMERFGGEVPRTVEELLTLPGVGRYTAGAIASLAYGVPAPIVDGNVQRVVCRLEAITEDPRTPAVQRRLWERATEWVPADRAGAFNSAVMELGATVCTPVGPKCLLCPVGGWCEARQRNLQDAIPPAKVRKASPLEERDVYIVRRGDGRVRIEQRPADGRWGGLWQFTTVPRGQATPVAMDDVRDLGEVTHALTHRRYHFRVRLAKGDGSGTWVTWAALDGYAMPKAHLKAKALVEKAGGAPA